MRCPWHHACFDLRNGEAVRAPALSAVECWKVERRQGKIFVERKLEPQKPQQVLTKNGVDQIVIVGGGAAGFAAAEMLRRHDFGGSIMMLSQDQAAPVRQTELVKRLPCRQCTGGLVTFASRHILRRQRRPIAT